MSANPVQLSTIGQIAIYVRDLDKATAFYRDTLGMEFIFQVPGMMSFFDCNGTRLMLGASTSSEDRKSSSVIYFFVEDIHETFAKLSERNVQFNHEPHSVGQLGNHEVWMAFFEDTDHNSLAIMSETAMNDR